MQVVKAWLKKWWAALLIGLAVAGGALGLYVGRKRVGRMIDQLTADRAVDEIIMLRQVKDDFLRRGKAKEVEIDRIDAEILDNKRAIVEAHEDAEGLSDDEVEAEFARLGF